MNRFVVALFAAASLVACGSNSTPAASSCAVPEPCGGSLIGTWKYTSTCTTGVPLTSVQCSGAESTYLSAETDGSITFQKDGTAHQTGSESWKQHATYPSTCISGTCADAQMSLTTKYTNAAAVCTSDTSGCSCDVTLARSVDDSDTYSITGDKVSITNALGLVTMFDYCVSGSTVTFVNGDVVTTAVSN